MSITNAKRFIRDRAIRHFQCKRGYSCVETARTMHLVTRTVVRACQKHSWPRNPILYPITITNIICASRLMSIRELSEFYSQSNARIVAILRDYDRTLKELIKCPNNEPTPKPSSFGGKDSCSPRTDLPAPSEAP